MVSMKDISVACGVSVATVSKALNDHKDIGETTKEKIRKTAKEMGYLPNLSARALKTNRTYTIGVLFSDGADNGLTHDHFCRVLDSFKRTVEANSFDITFVNNCKNRVGGMTYLEHSRYRGFDGILLACVDFEDPEVVELMQSDIPMVIIDFLYNNRISVMSDNVKGIHDLMEYIYRMGHRRIAYIHGDRTAVTASRLSSFYREAEQLGLKVPDIYVRETAYRNTVLTYRATRELLELPTPPTCILYPDDFAAFGGINAIREMGLQIPGDVSVVGYDGIPSASQLQPQLTTIKQDAEQVGRVAGNKLISLIEQPKTTLVEQIVIPGHLVEGKSVSRIELS